MIIEETKVVRSNIYVAPCVLCGSGDINLFDYGYSSPNIGGGKCKNCGHEVTHNIADWDPSKRELAKIWNAENDVKILIKQAQKRIVEDLALIAKLESK